MSRFDPSARRVACCAALCCLALLLVPGIAHAAVDPYPVDNLLRRFDQLLALWLLAVQTAANWLFWTLATISLTWTMAMMVFRHADFGELFAELVRFVVLTGIFWWLLSSGGGPDGLIHSILDSMKILGERAANDGGGPGLRPAALLRSGYEVFFEVSRQSGENSWTDADKIVGLMLATLILVLVALAAVSMMVIQVMFWVLAFGGLFLLGFGGARWTSGMAVNYYKHVLAVGMAYFTMLLLAGTGEIFLREYSNGVVGAVTLPNLAIMLVAAIVLLALLVRIPALVSGIVLGARFGGGNDGGSFSGRVLAMGGTAIASGIDRAGHGAQALYAAYRGDPAAAAPAPHAVHVASAAGGTHTSDLGATLPASVLSTHTLYNNDYGSTTVGSVFAATAAPHEVARAHAPAEHYRPVATPAAERPAGAPAVGAGTAAVALPSVSAGAVSHTTSAGATAPPSAQGGVDALPATPAGGRRAGQSAGGPDDGRDPLANAAAAAAGRGAAAPAEQAAAALRDAATATDPGAGTPTPGAEAIAPDAPLAASLAPAANAFDGIDAEAVAERNRSVLPPLAQPSAQSLDRDDALRAARHTAMPAATADWQATPTNLETSVPPPQRPSLDTPPASSLPSDRSMPLQQHMPNAVDLPPQVAADAPPQPSPELPQIPVAATAAADRDFPVAPASVPLPGTDNDAARALPTLQTTPPVPSQGPGLPTALQVPGTAAGDARLVTPLQGMPPHREPPSTEGAVRPLPGMDAQVATHGPQRELVPVSTPPSAYSPAAEPMPGPAHDGAGALLSPPTTPLSAATPVAADAAAAKPPIHSVDAPMAATPPLPSVGGVGPAAGDEPSPLPPAQAQVSPSALPAPGQPVMPMRVEAAAAASGGTTPLSPLSPPSVSASSAGQAGTGPSLPDARVTGNTVSNHGAAVPQAGAVPAAAPAASSIAPSAAQAPVLPAARPAPTPPASAPASAAARSEAAVPATAPTLPEPAAAADSTLHAASAPPHGNDASPSPDAPHAGGEDGH